MKRICFLAVVFFLSLFISQFSISSADEPALIAITVDSLTNLNGNAALEACGTAVHKNKIKPLIVTIKHDLSFYSTLTAPNDRWCVVFKRWNFNGEIGVSATTFQNPNTEEFIGFNLKTLH